VRQFRFSETTMDDGRRRWSRLIGTVAQYPTRADILRVVERFRLRINLKHRFAVPVTLDAVVDHYVERELSILRYGTQQSHLCTLNRWILPRWGNYLLEQVKPVEVEEWLRSLPLAPKSKANIRSLFHRIYIYVHARRWELTDNNPIDLVRQSAARQTIPRTLSTREIGLLLPQLEEPYRTMVLVAACLGLRVSEIMGLQWGDFNWEDLTLLVKRSVVHGRVGDSKTEASQLPLPVDPRLAPSCRNTGGEACTDVPKTGYLEIGMAGQGGRRVLYAGNQSRPRCVPGWVGLAGTRSAILIRPC
jgi:integrase